MPSLAALAEASRALAAVSGAACNSAVATAVFGERVSLPDVRATVAIVALLHRAPSLRAKACEKYLRGLCDARLEGKRELPRSALACFTVEQAAVFLGVEGRVMGMFAPVGVAPPVRPSATKWRSMYGFAFQPFPPVSQRESTQVFCLETVLRAARETHGHMGACLKIVERAVREDIARFRRAQHAEALLAELLKSAACTEIRDLEYALNAAPDVVAFRLGDWEKPIAEYQAVINKLVAVHTGLAPCYKCLLISDGNARLKAKRLLHKHLKRHTSAPGLVAVLEANLWWARARTNVQKMAQLRHSMPHIRV